MAACTHNNLLYGGPDYFAHGDQPCIHHAFTHAKALATVLDRGSFPAMTATPSKLTREEPYGIKSFPDIATHLVSIGDWRATVTDYDWEYVETVQAGGVGNTGGGHATGGALSMLYHQQLGPILAASMNQYSLIEISNQQQFTDAPHMTLTPRIEFVADGKTYTSLVDLKAKLTVINSAPALATFNAQGRLLTTAHQPVAGEGINYNLTYIIGGDVEIVVRATGNAAHQMRLIVPVISRSTESTSLTDPHSALFFKAGGHLEVSTDSPAGFELIPKERTFNLVPGFECVPLSILLEPGKEARVKFSLFYTSS
jgi:hypothetical protein